MKKYVAAIIRCGCAERNAKLKKFLKQVARQASTMATAMQGQELSCDADALQTLARSVCKKK